MHYIDGKLIKCETEPYVMLKHCLIIPKDYKLAYVTEYATLPKHIYGYAVSKLKIDKTW